MPLCIQLDLDDFKTARKYKIWNLKVKEKNVKKSYPFYNEFLKKAWSISF